MAVKSKAKRKGFSPLSLDAVNFLAADVRGAVGPYLIYPIDRSSTPWPNNLSTECPVSSGTRLL